MCYRYAVYLFELPRMRTLQSEILGVNKACQCADDGLQGYRDNLGLVACAVHSVVVSTLLGYSGDLPGRPPGAQSSPPDDEPALI